MTIPQPSNGNGASVGRPNWKDYSPAFNSALLSGLKIQAVLFVLTLLMLDGGRMHRAYLVALLCQLATVVLVLVRRPLNPTKVDLAIVRFGIVPLFVIVTWFGPDFLRHIGVEEFMIP